MSATAISNANFDYTDFDKEDKGRLIRLAGSVKQARELYNAAVFEVGKAIADAHAILAKNKTGSFCKWIEAECGLEERTAYNYMQTWRTFGEHGPKLSITTTAMYLLSAPEAPEKAAKEAIKLADKGEKITVPRAKELLEKFRVVEKTKTSTPPKVVETVSKIEPVTQQQVTNSDPPKTDDKPSKISGGASFDTAELDAAEAPKPPKNGAVVKPEFNDERCKAAYISLVKMLDERWGIVGGLIGHRATATKHLSLSFDAYQKWVKG